MKEIYIFLWPETMPLIHGRRYFHSQYFVYIPAMEGINQLWISQLSRFHYWLKTLTGTISNFGFSGGAFYTPHDAGVTPVIQVYKQLRAPAS